jgi:hypothetical protein
MKRYLPVMIAIFYLMAMDCQAGFLDDMSKELGLPSLQQTTLDDTTIVNGLKEALSTGTDRAVKAVAKPDGFFGNQAIKILMPEKIRNVADLLGKMGYQKQVDEVVLGMNRAAEKAAPKATEYFVGALKEMTFTDARDILQGGDTAATDYFKSKTSTKIQAAFKPIISDSMNDVGATRAYKGMMADYAALPFVSGTSFDIDNYVTTKAVDGLFTVLGEEEKKIRTDPAARGTELLRKVFGK